MEEIPSESQATKFTAEQRECEEYFVKTTEVLPSGRLQVRLPFKTDQNALGQSFETAARRFQALERRTLKDPEPRQMYLDFMEEYLALGHMSPTDNKISSEAHYFIPHQCVLRPQMTSAKILLQESWIKKLDWDESIPLYLNSSWQNFKANLLQLPSISIPRFIYTESSANCQIHGFADASIRAVAPLKTKSLPRLELLVAHLLAKLWSRIAPMLNRPIDSITFWTDSEIVLHWIKTHPSTLQTFVANRVSEIQELTQSASWRHVPTKQNPADQVSRGCSVDEKQNSIWFSGPQFLLEDPASWPINTHCELTPEEQALEKKKNASALVAVSDNRNPLLTVIEKYSSHKKLLRVFAYILRWVLKVRDRSTKYDPTPSAQELQLRFLKIVQIVQFKEYSQEITKFSKNLPLPSSLQKLNQFLHEYSEKSLSLKLLRVGGRLLNVPIPYDAKFPLLLSKNSQFVNSYIRFLHLRNHHAGAKALVAILREKIWFVGRRAIPVTIHCDNATNFVGADLKLKELKEAFLSQKEEVTQYAADEGFKFTFIPSRAPHFGGLWEAAVKSVKHLLVRAVGNASLTAEEIETLLVE
ncbi:uncharacterized protein LOC118752244, partial [Rhagoletis pomonella]|uniref:uncharacterized protein LOC118752244 n=1 Tax=Rhagoletis pomonella TaxID=28610 RepID=UPI001786BD0D